MNDIIGRDLETLEDDLQYARDDKVFCLWEETAVVDRRLWEAFPIDIWWEWAEEDINQFVVTVDWDLPKSWRWDDVTQADLKQWIASPNAVVIHKEEQTMKGNICGAPTKKGTPCKNKVKDEDLLCHHHIKKAKSDPARTIQAMIEACNQDSNKEEIMLPGITNPGQGMHYMLMSIDEYGNPVVLRRVYTNMDHVPDTTTVPEGAALVPSDIGDAYSMAFMEEFFGDTAYWVDFVPVWTSVDLATEYPKAALAWSDESTVTIITLPEHPHWGSVSELAGLEITPNMKLAKRLKEVTRVSRYFNHFVQGEVEVMIFNTPEDIPVSYYDGQTIVRRSYLEKLARNREDRNILRHEAKSGSIRLLGEFGLIKGDFIVARDDKELPADVVTHRDNVKTELKLVDNGMWGSVFLHHDHHSPVTDIQSLSWLGETIFPTEQLDKELRRVGMGVLASLKQGVFPKYMETYSDHEGNFSFDDPGVIADMRQMYNRWTSEGRSLNESGYFIHTIGTGFLNKMRSGMAFPIPHAAYLHVTTHEVLRVAGYGKVVDAMGDVVFYHDATGRLAIPGHLFEETFKNHGGWDLDDSVRILIRKFSTDGVKALMLRSPNAYGEYSVVDIDEDSFAPILYNTEGEMPDVGMTVEELRGVIPTIHELDEKVSYLGMPESDFQLGDKFTMHGAQLIVEAMASSPGVGAWANAQMVYYATFNTFRTRQLAHTEDIVDTLTQSVNPKGFEAIAADIKETLDLVIAAGHVEGYFLRIDRRVPQYVAEAVVPVNGHLTDLAVAHRSYMKRFADILVKLSNHERKPIKASALCMEVSPEYVQRAVDAEKWFRGLASKAPKSRHFDFTELEGSFPGASRLMLVRESQAYWRDANRLAVRTILNSDDPRQMVIAMYQYSEQCRSWKRDNGIDRILFAPNHPGEASVMDLLLSVLRPEIV
jgi:hypothetical protein